jgi:hypothetical protein
MKFALPQAKKFGGGGNLFSQPSHRNLAKAEKKVVGMAL